MRLRLRLGLVPALLLTLGCLCTARCVPCGQTGKSACTAEGYRVCSPGGGWLPWNYWSHQECPGEGCAVLDGQATCGVEPVERCEDYGATRCVDGRLQECSGKLSPTAPQTWRLRDEGC
jgi:hypothetical protein